MGTGVFPQGKIQVKKSVIDFFATVENYSKGYNRTNKEAFYLAKQYYKAKVEDPIGFHIYEQDKRKEFEEKFNRRTISKNELMLLEKVGVIYKIISSKYGRPFTDIISIPWYLKVHVLDIKRGTFKSSVGILGKTYLVAKIDEIIKGKNFFNKGDTIEINFLGNWLSDANIQFEKNMTYFAGLREWDCYNGNCTEIALYVFPDQDEGIYPIDKGRVTAPGNYFGIKDSLKWSDFKREFIKKYILTGRYK